MVQRLMPRDMTKFPIERFRDEVTPLYYYDLDLLDRTIDAVTDACRGSNFKVHYAVKANANREILSIIADRGFGADCVSGGEIAAAVAAGFSPGVIVYAGVGKSDAEIKFALETGISCFNVESEAELRVIAEIASSMGKTAEIALRVNPDIDAHTHHYITTGLSENKFGINLEQLDAVVDIALSLPSVKLKGLHFHIGSQIETVDPFVRLSERVNALIDKYEKRGVTFQIINVGGGLGIDYNDPDSHPVPDFGAYFKAFRDNLILREGQELHFELGRSIVAQCGSLITRVLYIKKGVSKNFAIVDAGMTELIRPALYQAHHLIQALTAVDRFDTEKYDVVGPICESSDCFGTDEILPRIERGDLLALRSAGAYGEIMSSHYNLRPSPRVVYSR